MTERKFHGLIDGDIILYECIAGKDDEVLAELCYAIDKRIKTLVEDAGVETYEIFLSGPKEVNYRYDVYPAYKAKRPPKPAHIVGAKQYMYDELGAIETEVGENDDLLGRHAMAAFKDAVARWKEAGNDDPEETQWFSKTLLMTTDKDLKMIPGWHYSWSPKSNHDWIWITQDQGYEWFFTQLLTGDSTDGIPGLKGVGPKAAEKVLAVAKTNLERIEGVVAKYVQKGHDLEYLYTMADLLWIQRDDRRGRDFLKQSQKMGFDLEGAFPQPEPETKLADTTSTATSEKFGSAKAKTSKAQEAFAKKDKAGIIHRRWLPGTKEEHQANIGAAKADAEMVQPMVDKMEELITEGEKDLKAGIEGEHIPADQKPSVSTYPDGLAFEFNDDIPF